MDRRSFLQSTGLLAAGALAGFVPAHAASLRSAPEFTGLDGWVNSTTPLTMAGLRGKVVLVDFWTYSCINCIRTVPYLNRWQEEYGPQGLQVVGIHTPEFGFEKMRPNVELAVEKRGIRYPVGQDNDFKTWRAWSNRAWPAFYLVDREGRIVLLREGEGFAHEMESAIRALLNIAGPATKHPGDDPDLSKIRTPEFYFGSQHDIAQDGTQRPRLGEASYSFDASQRPLNGKYLLDGSWNRESEPLILRSPTGRVRVRFTAAKMHLVAASAQPARLKITVDGRAQDPVDVDFASLYTLLDGKDYSEHVLDIETDTPGLTLYSATFG
ncbi:thioredoxin family protein [Roseiterribacter gracilis]|uniref:Thioredoxin domain-containing protein n=1 Tax=Roseiterribacter gracilis TaxID=2812848 RepID=A0A8S8XHU4_9PROT|nr:hypothetical protein TMPK1_37790 [Rhodospirillales bacterium TMPK1]